VLNFKVNQVDNPLEKFDSFVELNVLLIVRSLVMSTVLPPSIELYVLISVKNNEKKIKKLHQ
jgi:hypothetical protein